MSEKSNFLSPLPPAMPLSRLFKTPKVMSQSVMTSAVVLCNTIINCYTLKNKRVNQHLKGPRSDSVFIVLHLPYYPAGATSLKC